jgi:hypothetical protein
MSSDAENISERVEQLVSGAIDETRELVAALPDELFTLRKRVRELEAQLAARLDPTPEETPEYCIESEAMDVEAKFCGEVGDWLMVVGLEHARRRGCKHRNVDCIEAEDVEYAAQHLRAVMKLATPPAQLAAQLEE